MKISRPIHRQLRIKQLLSTLTVLALLASIGWLSTRYNLQYDITSDARNTLSSTSRNVLQTLTGPVLIEAYVKKDPALRTQIEQLITLYRRYKPDMRLTFIDPAAQPDKIRALDIPTTGAMFVHYRGQRQRIEFLDEPTLTRALLQLARVDQRRLTFLSGHGERSPNGHDDFDLGRFGRELSQRNIKVDTLNLAENPAIPEHSALLVIASPKVPLLPGELRLITAYLQRGGNLLWLADPDNTPLPTLEQSLGIRKLPGTILDDSARLYGIDDPAFILVSRYTSHPITRKFHTLTLYPIASALTETRDSDFNGQALFSSSAKSWTETGAIDKQARFEADSDEQEGPLALAYALTRDLEKNREQRVLVVGDGDFLANTFVDKVGNLELGLRMIDWLLNDDRSLDIPARPATDRKLALTQTAVAVIGFVFLIVIPLALITTGFLIWRRRKSR